MIVVSVALAAPTSLDIELYRPSVLTPAVYGVASTGGEAGDLGAAVVFHYTHDPLVLQQADRVVSAIVRDRLTLNLAGAWQPNRYMSVDLALPILGDWGAELPTEGPEGWGVGDLRVGGSGGPLRLGPVRGAARVDLYLPIGTRDAWMGEASVRAAPALIGELHHGRFSAGVELGAVLRPTITTKDLAIGPELAVNLGAGWEIWQERARISFTTINRRGITPDIQWGNFASELVAAVELAPTPDVRAHLLVGRGLTIGYGAPDLRVGVGVNVVRHRPVPKREARSTVVITPVPDVVTEAEVTEVEPPPPPPALARVEANRIVLRDPIQFELGTANILPESLPTLREVAAILTQRPEIAQLVIEGHASEEGSFLYNYDLSLSRASAIFKELVRGGVHPDRLSCRSMGEVQPVAAGADEAGLAQSRRVVFHIARWLAPGEPRPTYTPEILLPWSGEPSAVTPLPPPPPPAPPPEPTINFEEEEDE